MTQVLKEDSGGGFSGSESLDARGCKKKEERDSRSVLFKLELAVVYKRTREAGFTQSSITDYDRTE